MLSYRSRLNEKPPSTRKRDETVDVHFAEPVAKVGVCHTTDAVSGSVLLVIAWPRSRIARSLNTASLLRGDTCHVRRTTGFDIFSSDTPGSQLPGFATHAAKAAGVDDPLGSLKVFATGLS